MSAASSSSAAAAAHSSHAPHAGSQPHHRPATGSSSSSSSSSSSKPAAHHSHAPASAPSSASKASSSSSSSSSSSRSRSGSTRQFVYSRSSPNPWHITSAHLTTASPSLADGLSLAAQTLLRAETADFVSQMGQQCKITQWAIATGSVYLHVFFTRFSFARFDRFEVAATCLFLAGKVEERRTRVDQVINAYYQVRLHPPAASSSSSSSSSPSGSGPSSSFTAALHLLPPPPSSPECEALRQRIYSLEFALLDAIEFVFEVSHPYTNLMLFLKDIIFGPQYANKPASWIHKETSEKGGLAQIAWLFINDSLRSTLCLQFPPDIICVGVISLSLTYKQYEQPVRAGGSAQAKPWHEELFSVDRQTIDYISDVILTCVEQRYKPDPQQAQALLSSSVPLPVNSQLPTLQPPPSLAPLLAVPLSSSSQSSHKSRGPPASSATQRQQHPTGHRDRDGHAHHRPPAESAAPAVPEVIERVVPKSMMQQQQHQQTAGGAAAADRKRGRFPVPSQSPAVDQSQRAAPPASANAPPPQRFTVSSSQPKPAAASSSAAPAPRRGGYVWKPPPKNRRPAATTATEETGQKQQQPAAPTRPLSPTTPPSPELSAVSPLSRPPSPFLQSPLSASKRRKDGDEAQQPAVSSATSTASSSSSSFSFSRKRPHSPPSPPRCQLALSASVSALSRVDSRGETERTLVEQIGLKMRFDSGGKRVKEEGEPSDAEDERSSSSNGQAGLASAAADEAAEAGKAAEEQKEEEAAAGVTRYFLDGLDVMKGGRSDKRDDAEVMEDIHKMREEMEGEGEGGDAEHGAAAAAAAAAGRGRPSPRTTDEDDEQEDDDDHGRAWKRARHDDDQHGAYSPLASPFLRAEADPRGEEPGTAAAAAAAEQREGETDDAGSVEAESAPSSPHAGDESEHPLDSFSAVKQRRDDGDDAAAEASHFPSHLTQRKEGDADGHAPPLLSV